MNFATISGDIISYSSFSSNERRKIEAEVKNVLTVLTEKYKHIDFYGRLIQGDYIECAMREPMYSLRIGLIIKTYLKSINQKLELSKTKRTKLFFEHALRMAIAVAPLDIFNPEEGLIDGEAIFMSGRKIKNLSTHNKQKIIIKNTMFFCSPDQELENRFDTIFSLLDFIISKCSSKQSRVIYFKLLNYNELEIAKILNKYQSTINQHSTSAGWPVIEKSLNYYESIIK